MTGVAAAAAAVKTVAGQRYVVKSVDVTKSGVDTRLGGAQASWTLTVSGDGWRHQLVLGMATADEVVVEKWELRWGLLSMPEAVVVQKPYFSKSLELHNDDDEVLRIAI